MDEQRNTHTPQAEPTAHRDAIDINDFVFAATGARVRRLTLPDGTYWFPAVDICRNLGFAHVGSALRNMADTANSGSAETVLSQHSLSVPAGREWRRDMNLVNLHGLIRLVNSSTKPAAEPFKTWVSEVIAPIQRDGSYALAPAPVQPAPTGGTAYAMPQPVADALVRLEERNIRAEEMLTAFQDERNDLLHRIARSQSIMADALRDIAATLRHRYDRTAPEPELTAQDLVATWKAKNLVVTEDVHAVAAYLAPALVRGEARYRMEEISTRTGLFQERVIDSLRMLVKRGCVRQTGCTPTGAPVYVLPWKRAALTRARQQPGNRQARSRKTKLRLRALSYNTGFYPPTAAERLDAPEDDRRTGTPANGPRGPTTPRRSSREPPGSCPAAPSGSHRPPAAARRGCS
ncbi:BRO-N domain-containing protein [Streptomyces stelliscabiei]|uniref:BRO-N domain-containing protein n=1 Tax=Streptomyces stelliscabiei TaxID=146820 RepID=UPI0029CA6AC9|nr:Bro-N domain-containing protein [Streptomyces stelliscabiei]